MPPTVVDLLSTVTVVAVVGFCAVGLLIYDLVPREFAHRPLNQPERPVGAHFRVFGLVMTVAFVALATLRFTTMAG